MARDFVPAEGDKVTTNYTTHTTQRTYSIWAYTDGAGGGGRGRFFEKRVAGAEVELLYYNTTDANQPFVHYVRHWSGTNGEWRTPTDSLSLGAWVNIIVTYDAGATTNDPVIYLNGVSQTITQIVGDPTGSVDTNTDAYVLGARGSDAIRNFDGKLAEFAIFNRILTSGEIADLAAGVSASSLLDNGLVHYTTLKNGNFNDLISGSNSVDTGTVDFTHPTITYPAQTSPRYLIQGGI